jgi:hypothetical protein
MDDIYGLIPPLPSPLFLLTASLPCCSYCCACSVIDSLARKAPPRIMWPLVRDFIASKVGASAQNNQSTRHARFSQTTILRI